MRRSTIGGVGGAALAAAASAALFVWSGPAWAVAPRGGERPFESLAPRRAAQPVPNDPKELGGLLTARPQVGALLQALGPAWTVIFDRRNGEAMLFQGPGIPWLPGRGNRLDPAAELGPDYATQDRVRRASSRLARAEQLARELIRTNGAALSVADGALELAPEWSGGPDADGDQLLVTFRRALPGVVSSGRLTFVIGNGNLMQIHVERMVRPAALSARISESQARSELLTLLPAAPDVTSSELEHVILAPTAGAPGVYRGPLGRGYEQHLAWTFRFALGGSASSYVARVDALSGTLLELYDENVYATVSGAVFPRNGSAAEAIRPLEHVAVAGNGVATTTDLGGNFVRATGATPGCTLSGSFVNVADTCGSPIAATDAMGSLFFSATAGTDCTFALTSRSTRAARNAFYHLEHARQLGAKWLDGVNANATAWFGGNLRANVNVVDICNAYWNGSSVNFFRSGAGCNNTGEIADVMEHEWGHGLDQRSKTGGAGDLAKGEAVGDIIAYLMTHDRCVGPTFYQTSGGETTTCPTAVRDLGRFMTRATANQCPPGGSYSGALGYEAHCESHVLSGALYDLADLLVRRLGVAEGWNTFERIFLRAVPGMTSYLPNTAGNAYDQVLAADDDDGDVTNGTPNADLVYLAFNSHGIAGTQRRRLVQYCWSRPDPVLATVSMPGAGVQLAWTPVASATSYSVYRAPANSGSGAFLPLVTGLTTTSFLDAQVPQPDVGGTAYSYQVTVTKNSCSSPYAVDTPDTCGASMAVCGGQCLPTTVPILSGYGQCRTDCECGARAPYYCARGPDACLSASLAAKSFTLQRTIPFTGNDSGQWTRLTEASTSIWLQSIRDVEFAFKYWFTSSAPSYMGLDVRILVDGAEVAYVPGASAGVTSFYSIARSVLPGSHAVDVEVRSRLLNGPPGPVQLWADSYSAGPTELKATVLRMQ